MARQADLFPSPTTTIRVDAERGEPRLWLRRLVIWKRPGEVIREVAFRKGLNIVWSPDPGTGVSSLGHGAGTGHGAGKSLLCRLIRYCLGEDTFGDDALRAAVAHALPDGLVGAEVMIRGQLWGVVRPIGTSRKHIVAEDSSPDSLLTDGHSHTGMAPLLEAIGQDILPQGIEANMPGHKESKAWLFALAWLARDQECRFDHILDWRSPQSGSGSSVPGISKERLLVVVRTFLGIMDAEELGTRAELEAASEAKQKGERELLDLKRDATRLGRELIVALGAPEGVLDTGPIGVATLRQQARERLDAADEVATQDDVDAQLALLRTQLEDTIRKVAIAEEQVERTEGMVTIQNEQLKALRGERTNLDAEEIKAALGPVCPVCSVPVDEALARGCGLSNVFQHPAKIANDKARTDQQIKECESAIEQLQKKQSKLQTDCEALKGKEADLRQEIKGLERAAAKARRDQRQQWFAARRLVEDVDRLETLSHDRGEAQQKLDQTGETEEHLKATLKEHRQQHRDILQRVEELFDYVCKGILGSETESSLSLTGKGLQADLRVGGEAMNSLKTVAFDLATLLMSIEGRSGLPSFLIHDSPREADLGLSHYHQYFRLMSELERVAGEPPFQYIVTTTTDPPEYHQTQPYLVAQLSGSDQEGRLLRRSLDVVPHGNTD